jgi:VWFA-related protein
VTSRRPLPRAIVFAILGIGASHAADPWRVAAQQSTFRSAVDVIAVDVQVVDRDGQPMMGLAPASFSVTIDGRRRRVLSAEMVRSMAQPSGAASADADMRRRGTNLWPSDAPGRTFVLAIDTASFSAGESAHVSEVARRFVDHLTANDRVGVYALPHGVALNPTGDRVATRRALASIAGMQALRPGQFHLTPSEVVDITAANGAMESMGRPLGRGQVAAPSPLEMNEALRQVQLRECRSTTDQACLAGILAEADGINRQFEDEAEESLASLYGVMTALAGEPDRRTVVVLSAGIPVSDRQGSWHSDGGQARKLGQMAARAGATIYAIHLDRGYSQVYSAEARHPKQDLARERELEELLLNELAVTSGGTLLSAPTGSIDAAFSRLLRETSTYYLLGVSPEGQDMDGRTHALNVKVAPRGAIVRSRQYVLLPKPK